MKTFSRGLLCVLFSFLCLHSGKADDPKPAAPSETWHDWKSISYPAMTPWRKALTQPSITIENKGPDGMELSFHYYLPSYFDQQKHGKLKPETVRAEFYRNKEKPVKLTGSLDSHPYYGSGPSSDEGREITCDHVFVIPWGRNSLDDAWVVLRLKDRNFWVELPYGFTRNPDDPLAPASQDRGEPVFPVAPKTLSRDDLIIPWEYVTYRLETLSNGVRIWLNLSNPCHASAELHLSGFDGDVREPRATVTLPGIDPYCRCVSTVVDEIDLGVTQMFRYGGFGPFGTDDRRWSVIRVSIKESHTFLKEKRTFAVPSSLFNYGHGHVEIQGNVPQLRNAEKWYGR